MWAALKSICKRLFVPANSTLEEGEARGEMQGWKEEPGKTFIYVSRGLVGRHFMPPGSS